MKLRGSTPNIFSLLRAEEVDSRSSLFDLIAQTLSKFELNALSTMVINSEF